MLAQITSNVLYVGLAASVLFQVATVVRLAARTAYKRNTHERKVQPAARLVESAPVTRPAPPKHSARLRRRDYRLALRAAKASLSA